MKTPKYGTRITKMSHAALPQPERSRRLNTSPKTVIKSQNQITHAKNTSIVHITSRNGYELAITINLLCRIDCDRPKNSRSHRAYAYLKIDVYHSTRMTATVGVHGGVCRSAEWKRRESNPHRFQSVITTSRKRSIMGVTCSGTS